MTAADIVAALVLVVWAYLILLHGGFWLAREREDGATAHPLHSRREWPRVTAIVPARNEADMIPRSLASLLAQRYPGEFSIVLVDDQSNDGTAEAARSLAQSTGRDVIVVNGAPLPPAWTGKVWALHQGVALASTAARPPDYFLLTDADIAYRGDVLTALVAHSLGGKLALTSVMAKLNAESIAERALIPAFIFFFKMLYPFAWVNRREAKTAAAAGGCMLVDRRALESAGGIEAIRGALIDDCSLAKLLKKQGPVWLGLSQRVTSLRSYPSFETIHRMVARSAYAQLRYSPWLLIGTVVGMGCVYVLPPMAAGLASYPANVFGAAAYLLMIVAFQPTLRFYNRSPLWGLAMPLIAATYVGFTLDSAYQHSLGRGGLWKGRVQAKAGSNDARH